MAAVSPRTEAIDEARWGDVDVTGDEGPNLDTGLLTSVAHGGGGDTLANSSGHFAEWESLPDKYLQSDSSTYLTYFKVCSFFPLYIASYP